MVTIPLESVTYRDGAVPRPDMVNVLDAGASKENARSPGPTGDAAGLELETKLSVQAWVRNVAPAKHTWVDLHLFDENDQLIRGETLALEYQRPAGDDGDIYAYDGSVYRGTGAVGGSVWFGQDARKVQYRLYYEVNGTVFSDGLLRQHDLASDGEVMNPSGRRATSAAAKPAAAKPAAAKPAAAKPAAAKPAAAKPAATGAKAKAVGAKSRAAKPAAKPAPKTTR